VYPESFNFLKGISSKYFRKIVDVGSSQEVFPILAEQPKKNYLTLIEYFV